MSGLLPPGFGAAEPFVADWALPDAAARMAKRQASRIEELKGLGLAEKPGALKLYRQVMLADDGGPAAILLSEDGEKQSINAKDILDRFINAIKDEKDEKIHLSDQALVSGNDDKPPSDAQGENAPLEDRVEGAREFLGVGTSK